jgi:hypothetical protein
VGFRHAKRDHQHTSKDENQTMKESTGLAMCKQGKGQSNRHTKRELTEGSDKKFQQPEE